MFVFAVIDRMDEFMGNDVQYRDRIILVGMNEDLVDATFGGFARPALTDMRASRPSAWKAAGNANFRNGVALFDKDRC